MVTKNDVTGDSLITKASSEAYRNNYDLIFKKKEPVVDPVSEEQHKVMKGLIDEEEKKG